MTALDGLKVLDVTRVRAGPHCCRVLADFGADVVKIDAPEGLDANANVSGSRHGFDMLNLHRNKRSITINLRRPDGKALFLDLARHGRAGTTGRRQLFAVVRFPCEVAVVAERAAHRRKQHRHEQRALCRGRPQTPSSAAQHGGRRAQSGVRDEARAARGP